VWSRALPGGGRRDAKDEEDAPDDESISYWDQGTTMIDQGRGIRGQGSGV
jgi:hypothetical protein